VTEAVDARRVGAPDADMANCWRTHRRRGATGTVETQGGVMAQKSMNWTLSKARI
jgi:hypothetical protein